MKLYSSPSSSSSSRLLSAIRLTGSPSLILDTIKRGEDDEDVSRGELPIRKGKGQSIIVRIYDSLGGTSRGVVRVASDAIDLAQAFSCNILEDDEHEVDVLEIGTDKKEKGFDVECKPFEVRTYRLVL